MLEETESRLTQTAVAVEVALVEWVEMLRQPAMVVVVDPGALDQAAALLGHQLPALAAVAEVTPMWQRRAAQAEEVPEVVGLQTAVTARSTLEAVEVAEDVKTSIVLAVPAAPAW
jgi:hypothetical protein